MIEPQPVQAPPAPLSNETQAVSSALAPALIALLLPLAAFALAWAIAGTIPMAVPKAQWGTWFAIGALMGATGIAGLVFTVKAFLRGGYRSLVAAALVLNLVVMLIAWAGLFA